jgi:hypothetical protein
VTKDEMRDLLAVAVHWRRPAWTPSHVARGVFAEMEKKK